MKNITKFYYSTMKGAPVLSSNWGSLLKALRIVLVDGFNKNPIISNTVEEGLRKFTFVEDPGYLLHQVVTLSGCITNPELNGEYRVQKIEGFSVYLSTEDVISTLGGDMFLLTSPMGWSEVFTGTDKAVFKAKDTLKNPFFLRIDNSLPTGYDPSWGKFARVTMAEYMLGIDDFGDFAKAPVYKNLPKDTNELGNKVTGANGIFGMAKWYHGVDIPYYFKENSVGGQSTSLSYEIVGDDTSLYFLPRITSRKDSRALYAFTPFISIDSKDILNCFLSATHHYKRANQEDGESYGNSNNSFSNKWHSLDSVGKYGLSRWDGVTGDIVNFGPFSLNVSNSQQVSGRSENIPFPNPGSNSVVLSDIYLKESTGGLRGTLPIIKWINNRWSYGNKFMMSQNNEKYIILGNDYLDEGMTSFFAYRLER